MPRVVVDTTIWFVPEALIDLHGRLDMDVVVPAIVFTERARQLARDKRMTPRQFLRQIRMAGWGIEEYGVAQALPFAAAFADDTRWLKLARDAMIAGHVRDGDLLWTANVRDFQAVGLPRNRIMDIGAFAAARRASA